MQVSAEELRDFANGLNVEGIRGDLARQGHLVAAARVAVEAMPESKDPDNFIAEWGPLLQRTAADLVRCTETLSSVAQTAADQFETTDQNHALIMRRLLEQAHGAESLVDPDTLSKAPETRPGGDLQDRPEEPNEVASKYGNLGGGIPRPEMEGS